MDRISPISYIRKQQKFLATTSLVVAFVQVFGQTVFVEKTEISQKVNKQFYIPSEEISYPSHEEIVENDAQVYDTEADHQVIENAFVNEMVIPTENPVTPDLNSFENVYDKEPEVNKQGIIGKSETFPIDDPSDNMFSVSLDELPASTQDIYLTYDIYGLADASGASVTINDNFSRGGYLVKKSNSWSTHKEKINPEELTKGSNFIRFSTLEAASHQYMVRNVQLIVENKNEADNKENNLFTIHQAELNSYDGKLYISGFADKKTDFIKINDNEIPVRNGIFETIIENVGSEINISQGNHNITLPVTNQQEDQPDNLFELSHHNAFVSQQFFPANENLLSHQGASLNVPANSITKETIFFMSALRYQDLSVVSPEMVNVTGNHSGYRLLPHGEHFVNVPATLEIPYDESKIPPGYKPQDIKTFYFDTHQSKWVALQRDTILLDKKVVVSKTTHFTDFVNGIIKVPESPETGSFTPTSIKDIKAADPAAGVVSIPPPTPNNMGTANTSFPIKLPAGRAGMQPSLSVNYNSEGGNGWMGIGWDISVPSISIDTRWGAPRYDGSYETEMYAMGGEMLTLYSSNHENSGSTGAIYTNPHRTAKIVRTNNRIFYPRKEDGSYLTIKRNGTSPSNYWWEVTDKMGNKSFYGGYTGLGVVDSTVIRTGGTNTPIAHWALYRTEDANGNYVEYSYTQGNGAAGYEFYPKDIVYTKHKTAATSQNYKVSFVLSSSIGIPSNDREDVQTNARLGLIQATSKLLTEMKIDLMEGSTPTPIRSYKFNYETTNFNKKQLTKISEHDTNGNLFYSNTMEYFSEVTDGNFIADYGQATNQWSTPNDNTDGGLLLSGVSGDFNDKGSILGASKGWGFSGGAAINVGLGFNIFSRLGGAGVNFGYGYSQDNGLISFTDINGDGLPDKIIKDGSSVKYRPNNGNGFGNLITINSLSDFSKSSSNTFNVGVEANFGIFLGYTYSNSKSKLKTYFADVNGDGLVDLVNNGSVIFNSNQLVPEPNYNERIFMGSSGATPNHIQAGIVSGQIQEILQPIDEEDILLNENPLHDVVKVWTAPRDGNYVINSSTVTLQPLVEPDDNDEYKADYDGVIIRIEKGNSNNNDNAADIIANTTRELIPIYNETTDEVTFGQSATLPSTTLNGLVKGQRIYFRVHSKNEGSYDRVEWNPSVSYISSIDKTDANGFLYYSSSASEGFIVSQKTGINVPANTPIRIKWEALNLSQFEFSDNLTFVVESGVINSEGEYTFVQNLYSKSYNHTSSSPTIIEPTTSISNNFTLSNNRVFYFKVLSNSNVDWKSINWKPQIIIDDPIATDDIENPISTVVEYGIYNKKLKDGVSRIGVDTQKSVRIVHNIPNTITIDIPHNEELLKDILSKGKSLNLIVKNSNNRVLYTLPVNYSTPSITNMIFGFRIEYNFSSVIANNINISTTNLTTPIFVEFYTDNKYFNTYNFSADARQLDANNVYQTKGTSTDIYAKDGNSIFGPEYRNWGQFAYRSQGETWTAINEQDLELPQINQDNAPSEDPFSGCPGEPGSVEYEECVDQVIADMGIQDPMDATFIIMTPNPNKEILEEEIYLSAYEGYDNDIYVEEAAFSSSRMGFNNIESILVDFNIEEQAVPGITIISKGEGDSEVAGAGPIGGSWSQSFNYQVNQFSDMNGDRYPDIITENKIQYTTSTGKLDDNDVRSFNFGRVSTGENTTSGSSVAGTFLFANTGSSNSLSLHSMQMGGTNIPVIDPVTAPQPNSSASLSYNSSSGTNNERLLWIDMNGDGLPDRVRAEEAPLTVQLNLGYKFSEPQVWERTPDALSGVSRNDSGGAGFSILNNSWGGGISASTSRAYTNENFVDINGDGLPDLILNPGAEIIQYRLNSGVGFGDVLHSVSKAVAQSNRSTAEGANVAFTFGITGLFVKVTTSISASVNHFLNRVESTISDIDGDGYADLLYTTSNGHDGELKVRLNKTGKTHLLKKVHTPLGGTWEIDYEREKNSYEMPNAKWKLKEITTNDNFLDDNTFTPDITKTTVKYYGGRYDRREREFMGYGEVQVNQLDVLNGDAVYRYSLQEFHTNSFYLKGAVKKESLYDANDVLWTSSETTYAIMERGTITPSNTHIDLSNHVFNSSDFEEPIDKSSLFVSPVRTTKKFTEGGSGNKITFSEIKEFDANGNITLYEDNGEGGSDKVTTHIKYEDPNYRGLPTHIEVEANGSPVRQRDAKYDAKANLEWIKTKLNNENEYAQVSFEYLDENGNNYGNIQKVTHENSLEDYENPNSTKFFYEYTYDDQLHTYPVKIEDAFGYSSNNTYEYLFGTLVYTEDMNYQPMRTRIDNRGRVIEITGPYELFVEGLTNNNPAWTIRFEYKGEDPLATRLQGLDFNTYMIPAKGKFNVITSGASAREKAVHHAVTRHFDPEFRSNPEAPETTNEIYTITLVDGLGKPIQVKKSISVKKATPTYHTGEITPTVIDARDDRKWLISGKVYTDGFGRALETHYPTTVDYAAPTGTMLDYVPTAPGTNSPVTKATYDILDRVLTTTLPGESASMQTSYAIDENRFKTTVVNEKGQTKQSFTDIRGRTTKVVEQSTVHGNITTQFKYNAIGELLEVEDAGGYKTISKYDLAGRRIELNHPDNGVTRFKYDKASNLTEKETSNLLHAADGDKIKYSYTFNRLDSINYPLNPHNNVQFFYGQAEDASAADDFTVGRLWYQIDASGVQQFKYGRLGEVTYNLRSVAVPGDKAYWFQTKWEYDTWNRMKKITYPDEEEVTYFYNRGGELHAMTSKKNGQQNKNIISQMGYDHFGQRTYLRYGNGTETTYTYEANRRRLDVMLVKSNTAGGAGQGSSINRTFINNKYTYDILSNITGVVNSATDATATQIGGKVTYGYTYDDLNRLTTANGVFTGRNSTGAAMERQQYTLSMDYDKLHNIVSKQQLHQSAPGATGGTWTDIPATTYRLDYKDESEDGYASAEYNVAGYQYTQPHAPRKITDKPKQISTGNDIKTKLYDYDPNGNLTHITQQTGDSETVEKLRTNLWDEENRLRAVDITPDAEGVRPIAIYTYDAGGERILKHNNTSVSIFLNGKMVADTIQTDATIYPSGMLVAKLGNNGSEEEQTLAYTKHYYAGTQRVSSKIGTTENLGDFLQDWFTGGTGGPVDVVGSSNNVLTNAEQGVVQVYDELGITPPTFDSNPVFIPVQSFTHGAQEIEHYFFHPDHLGSSSYITNFVGEVSQHMEYFAFGETFVEEHRSSNNSPYKFNGKELDEETGWYYYGARYYDARTSIWLSVDPLAEKYPSWSPYVYTFNNPINLIDPDGREPVPSYYSLNPWFKLKPTQWYSTAGAYDSKTFNAAAKYSTQHLRSDAFQSVYQRNAYYGWVQGQADAKGYNSKWFGAAELVTRRRGVGGTELPDLGALTSKATDKFLQGGNEFLFSHNMKNAKDLLADGKLSGHFNAADGYNYSFEGLSGMELDFKLVEFEQSKVQEYINSYKGKDLNDIISNINEMMNGSLPSSEVRDVIKNKFNNKFDFSKYKDRVKLGQELIKKAHEE